MFLLSPNRLKENKGDKIVHPEKMKWRFEKEASLKEVKPGLKAKVTSKSPVAGPVCTTFPEYCWYNRTPAAVCTLIWYP